MIHIVKLQTTLPINQSYEQPFSDKFRGFIVDLLSNL